MEARCLLKHQTMTWCTQACMHVSMLIPSHTFMLLSELAPRFLPWIETALESLRPHLDDLPPGTALVPCCGPGMCAGVWMGVCMSACVMRACMHTESYVCSWVRGCVQLADACMHACMPSSCVCAYVHMGAWPCLAEAGVRGHGIMLRHQSLIMRTRHGTRFSSGGLQCANT